MDMRLTIDVSNSTSLTWEDIYGRKRYLRPSDIVVITPVKAKWNR